MITKTWECLNRHCRQTFNSTAGDYPPCTRCGGIRVKWVPMPFGIKSEKTKQADRDVTGLRDIYGDKNFRSPVMGESNAPRVNPSVARGKTTHFSVPYMGTAWAADVPVDAAGNPISYCAPTGITAKVPVTLNARAAPTKVGGRQLGVGAKLEAAHRPKP